MPLGCRVEGCLEMQSKGCSEVAGMDPFPAVLGSWGEPRRRLLMNLCSVLRAAEPRPAAASAEARPYWDWREVADLGLGQGGCMHRAGKVSAEVGYSKPWDFRLPGWAGVKRSMGRC